MSGDLCYLCFQKYSKKVIPAILTCCGEGVCVACCRRKYKKDKISTLTGSHDMIKCMFCYQRFDSVKGPHWIINKPVIKLLNIGIKQSTLQQAQALIGHSSESNNGNVNSISGSSSGNESDQSIRYANAAEDYDSDDYYDNESVTDSTSHFGRRYLNDSIIEGIINTINLYYQGYESYEPDIEDCLKVLLMALFCDNKFTDYIYVDILDVAITYASVVEYCGKRFNLDAVSTLVEETTLDIKEGYSRYTDLFYGNALHVPLHPDVEESLKNMK